MDIQRRASLSRIARATLGTLLVFAGTMILWSILLWITFQLPGTPSRVIAELSSNVDRRLGDKEYAASFLDAGRTGLWLIFGLLPSLAGLGIGFSGRRLALGHPGSLIFGSLLAALAILAAGTLEQPSAWVGAAGLLLAATTGYHLRRCSPKITND